MTNLLQLLYAELLPVALQAIAALLGLILVQAANTARSRWGIEIEARHREALQSALMTGIAAALSKGLTGKPAIQLALQHVLAKGAPDAVRYFKLRTGELELMAASKLGGPPAIIAETAINEAPALSSAPGAPAEIAASLQAAVPSWGRN